MSEQQQKPKSFMQELDEWTDASVVKPLVQGIMDDLKSTDSGLERSGRDRQERHPRQSAGELPKRPSGRTAGYQTGAERRS